MKMSVYLGKKLICVETAIDWAVPYWTQRKRMNPRISWVITEV